MLCSGPYRVNCPQSATPHMGVPQPSARFTVSKTKGTRRTSLISSRRERKATAFARLLLPEIRIRNPAADVQQGNLVEGRSSVVVTSFARSRPHGHDDVMNVLLNGDGGPLLVDSGGPYLYGDATRSAFTGVTAHNTVVPAGGSHRTDRPVAALRESTARSYPRGWDLRAGGRYAVAASWCCLSQAPWSL